jgi:hypothetical protein
MHISLALFVFVSLSLITSYQMIDSLSMICHVLEPTTIAAESIDRLSMFFKDKLVVVTHGVKAGYDVRDFLDFGR